MSGWLPIWIVLIILYLYECLVRHAESDLLIVRGIRGRLKFADQTIFRFRRGLVTLGPVLPWERLSTVHTGIVAISPLGFTSISKEGASTSCPTFNFSEVTDLTTLNESIVVNDRIILRCDTAAQAKKTAVLLERLRAMSLQEREERIISELASALDIESVRRSSDDHNLTTANLRFLGIALWFGLFFVFPVLVFAKAPTPAFGMLFSIAGLVLVNLATEYYFCMRGINPSASKAEICSSLLQMMLCPAIAPRAAMGIEFQSYADYHPLAVACGLSRGAPNLVTDVLIRRTLSSGFELQENPVLRWFFMRLRAEAKQQLTNHCPHFLESAFKPPTQNVGSRSYCPRCHAQYGTEGVTCSDCKEVPLTRFPQVAR
jgi:hypothetical protein